ncbi:Uncharacterized protein PBTT_03244 [Plasmodiophora brassicae]
MFFGLTQLGPQCPFTACAWKDLSIRQFQEDQIGLAFDALCSSMTPRGRPTVDRLPVSYDAVRRCLRLVYGFESPPGEIGLVLTRLRRHEGKTFDREEWLGACRAIVDDVKTISEAAPVEYHSLKELTADNYRSRRFKYDPQLKFRKPLLTSHQVGWFKPGEVEQVVRKPNITCPETQFAGEMIKAGVIF